MAKVYEVRFSSKFITNMVTEGMSMPPTKVVKGLPEYCRLIDVQLEPNGDVLFLFVPETVEKEVREVVYTDLRIE